MGALYRSTFMLKACTRGSFSLSFFCHFFYLRVEYDFLTTSMHACRSKKHLVGYYALYRRRLLGMLAERSKKPDFIDVL